MKASALTELLVRNLDQAFRTSSWHGPNLRNSIRGVDPQMAAWRPQPDRHNIWEFVVHAAYWKYAVYRRISDDTETKFGLKGSNWIERPVDASKTTWHDDIRHLEMWHERLRGTVAAFQPSKLARKPTPKSEWTFEALILGAASHDLYHAGQIRLLRRMWEDR